MIKNEIDYDSFKADGETKGVSSNLTKKNISTKTTLLSRFSTFITKIISNKQLISKLAVTVLIVVIYRILASVPLPGIDMAVYQQYFGSQNASEVSYLLQIFTGGSLDSPSIVGMGILAYINASIIVQLLTPVIPKLLELSKEGAQGQQIINQYTRYLTLPLSVMYSIVYVLLIARRDLNSVDGVTPSDNPVYLVQHMEGSDWPSIQKIIFMSLLLTAGTMLVMWLAEFITEKGIGNGSSIIITLGILAGLPAFILRDLSSFNVSQIATEIFQGNFSVLISGPVVAFTIVILGTVVLTLAIVFVNESIRNIKIQHSNRKFSGSDGDGSVLPVRLTMSGVLPIIFASSLLTVPQIIIPLMSQFRNNSEIVNAIVTNLENSFFLASSNGLADHNDFWYALVYFIFIISFGYYYSFLTMKPADVAENLQKGGRYIPGIRPGKSTEKYLSNIIGKIGISGAAFLAIVALIPITGRTFIQVNTGIDILLFSGIGGTSILIVVGVLLDIMRQIKSLQASRSYEQYA